MKRYHMESEIAEQAEMLRREHRNWSAQANECRALLAEKKHIAVVGRGSSGNACIFLSYLWGLQTGRQAVEFRPWLASHKTAHTSDWSEYGVLAFSVSGGSTDIAHAASWLRERGARVVGVTNADEEAETTHLGKASDLLFRLHAGPERAVPATKTFCAQLFASAALCGYELEEAAEQTADCFDEITKANRFDSLTDFLIGARQVAWLARGPAMAVARDAALKLQETAALPSTGYSSAEFLHGPVGSFNHEDRAIIFLDGDAAFDNHDTVMATLLNKKTPVLLIAKQKGESELYGSTLPMPLPEPVWARGAILGFLSQQAALRLALRKELNPDAPAGLRKVTQT